MTPASTGRHCAACQQTVVDFTRHTDAEILAYLAGAVGTRTCGRFAAGQLERPLQRAAPAAPTARWRSFLAAALAVWGVREGVGTMARGQAPVETRPRYWGGPAPAAPPVETIKGEPAGVPAVAEQVPASLPLGVNLGAAPFDSLAATALVLRGTVVDASTNEGMPGVTVLLKGTSTWASTNREGAFELKVPAEFISKAAVNITVSSVGYVTQQRTLATRDAGAAHKFRLEVDVKGMLGGEVVIVGLPIRAMPPAPWRPRAFYHWSRYQVMRPFRRG
jgi:hypothetical protein